MFFNNYLMWEHDLSKQAGKEGTKAKAFMHYEYIMAVDVSSIPSQVVPKMCNVN